MPSASPLTTGLYGNNLVLISIVDEASSTFALVALGSQLALGAAFRLLVRHGIQCDFEKATKCTFAFLRIVCYKIIPVVHVKQT